jgi:hypothetical protein
MLFPNVSSGSMSRGVAYNIANRWPSGIIPYDISAIISEKHSFNLTYVIIHIFNSIQVEQIIIIRDFPFLRREFDFKVYSNRTLFLSAS